MHDGRADTLTRFLVDGFGFDDNQEIADMIAFLLSISGGDTAGGGDSNHPVDDAHVATGRQVTMTSPEPPDELTALLALNEFDPPRKRFDIVASGRQNGTNRTWVYSINAETGLFDSDRNGESLFLSELYPLASPESPLTFMAVVEDSGRRMGIDRDGDGFLDRSELDQDSNARDVTSPSNLPPPDQFTVGSQGLVFYAGTRVDQPLDDYGFDYPRHPNRRITFSIPFPDEAPLGASIDPTGTRFIWDVPKGDEYVSSGQWDGGNIQTNIIRLRVTDNALTEATDIFLELWTVRELRIFMPEFPNLPSQFSRLTWMGAGTLARYEIQVAESPAGPWRRGGFLHRDSIWFGMEPSPQGSDPLLPRHRQ